MPSNALDRGRAKPARALPQTLAFALWLGLATAAGEVGLLLIKRYLRGQMIDAGPHFVWLLASADIALFGLTALVVAGGARLAGRRDARRIVFFTLIGLSALALLLHYRPIHMYARLLAAAGIATAGTAVVLRYWSGWMRLAWLTAPTLVVAVGLTAIWQVRSGRTDTAVPGTAGANQPNVLMLILDTVAARDLSLYGYSRATSPNLEALASRGVTFERAMSPSSWTVPSHASIFTGEYPFDLSADWETALDARSRTLAESFGVAGYATALIAGNRFLGREYGLDRGFGYVSVEQNTPAEALRLTSIGSALNTRGNWIRRLLRYYRPLARRRASDINADFLEWAGQQGDRPFFAVLNYIDAHAPYVAPAPFDDRFEVDAPRTNPMMVKEWTDDAIEAERAAYDEAIAYLDDQVGRLMRELERNGILDHTIVVITADHGEQFGEHGHMEHSGSLYLPSLWVPLIVIAPGDTPPGVRVRAPATLRDVPATVLDLAGIPARLPGQSLAGYWAGRRHGKEVVAAQVSQGIRTDPDLPISRGDMMSLIRDRHQYILNGDGTEELYDIEADPLETINLATNPVFAPVLFAFRFEIGDYATRLAWH